MTIEKLQFIVRNMETTRLVVELDEDDSAALEKARESFRAKHGPVSNAFVIRTLLREYVAAKEQEQK